MTKKENLLKVLRCEEPEWVPFVLNFQQWFVHHKSNNRLPDELKGCEDYIDAMKALDTDIFTRNLNNGCIEKDTIFKRQEIIEEKPLGTCKTLRYETPYGIAQEVHQEQRDQSTWHDEEFFISDWEKNGKAAMAVLEQTDFVWEKEVFEKSAKKIGDDGIFNLACWATPLKWLHWKAGLQDSCFLIMDNPKEIKEYCDLYWSKLTPILKEMADHPEVNSVMLMDNVDTPFYGSFLAEEYWTPYVQDAVSIMKNKGKFLWVHACGQLSGLAGEFTKSKVTGLEGVSHQPIGDWTVKEALNTHPEYIFNGGFSGEEQRMEKDEDVKAFYKKYLAEASKKRFMFGASCNTSIGTSWERIKLVRDIVREWGGKPK